MSAMSIAKIRDLMRCEHGSASVLMTGIVDVVVALSGAALIIAKATATTPAAAQGNQGVPRSASMAPTPPTTSA